MAIAIKRLIEPEEKEEAKERMLLGKPCADSAEGRGETRKKIAAYIDVSHDTLMKQEALVGQS